MNPDLTDNTKAILLLTAPLLTGKGRNADGQLTLSEYNKLARCLQNCSREPSELLGPGKDQILRECQSNLDHERIGRLLERGLLLSQTIESWRSRSIWVMSRADDEYPKRFKERLGKDAPPVLYGCGDASLLDCGGLAVVGSRDISQKLLEYAEQIGRTAAQAQCHIVSGAARGVDQAAMNGALKAGGAVSGVLSGGLEREAVNRGHREMLMDGQLVLLTPYDPKASFDVGNAMQRNKLIYALADAGLVIESGKGSGGTWTGAVEQLDKLHLVPVYTRAEGDIGLGLRALRQKGALEWPNPKTPEEFKSVFAGTHLSARRKSPCETLPLPYDNTIEYSTRNEETTELSHTPSVGQSDIQDVSYADVLFTTVEELIKAMGNSVSEAEVVQYLRVEKRQAKAWLQRLASEGKYSRTTRPVRYNRTLFS